MDLCRRVYAELGLDISRCPLKVCILRTPGGFYSLRYVTERKKRGSHQTFFLTLNIKLLLLLPYHTFISTTMKPIQY